MYNSILGHIHHNTARGNYTIWNQKKSGQRRNYSLGFNFYLSHSIMPMLLLVTFFCSHRYIYPSNKQFPWLEATDDELASRKHQTCKADKSNGNQILRTPSKWLPFDLNAGAFHLLPTLGLFRQIKASPFHPQFLNTPRKRSVIIPLPLQLLPHLPEPEKLHLNQ